MAKKRSGNRETESSPLVEQEPRPSRETPVLKGISDTMSWYQSHAGIV